MPLEGELAADITQDHCRLSDTLRTLYNAIVDEGANKVGVILCQMKAQTKWVSFCVVDENMGDFFAWLRLIQQRLLTRA